MRLLITILAVCALLSSAHPSHSQSMNMHERIQFQRAIEDVYWQHRVWPQDNRQSKPNLDVLFSDAFIAHKVDSYMKKSYALGFYWQRPIKQHQLLAELRRMVRESRQPERLRELFAALHNDPYLIAECLARPLLADRLVRHFYAYDARFHGDLKTLAKQELASLASIDQMSSTLSGEYRIIDWVLSEQKSRQQELGNEIRLNSKDWEEKNLKLAGLFGVEVISKQHPEEELPIGSLTPLQEDADRFYVLTVLERNEGHIRIATETWQKRSFDDWWQTIRSKMQPNFDTFKQQIQFELPKIAEPTSCTDDTWSTVTGPEVVERNGHSAVWTGSEMIIWGGNAEYVLGSGARYDPATDTWSPISAINAPSPRFWHTAIWTGSQMIVWGGEYDWVTTFNDGGRYDPATDSWTPISMINAPNARYAHTAVWTSQEMIVWGGDAGGYLDPLNTGGRYDPSTDSWITVSINNAPSERIWHTGIWTSNEMIIWGGEECNAQCNGTNTGARYNPSTDSWTSISTVNAPEARALHSAIYTGVEMIIWGGARMQPTWTTLDTGAKYNPATDTWTAITTTGAPSPRWGHTMIWTSEQAIVWGGAGQGIYGDGARYNPIIDSWVPMTNLNAPSGRLNHTVIWTGTEMIIWGGYPSPVSTRTGGRYDPINDSWIPTSVPNQNIPTARKGYSLVWTGAESIVWGGFDGFYTNTGSRYDPATNNWIPTTTLSAPDGRTDFTAVWTGTEMIVWGGWTGDWATLMNTGGRYDPFGDSWTPASLINTPDPQFRHTAVWTGSEMIIWGEFRGGRYDPFTDTWASISDINAPPNRFNHSVVWTGSEMIIWGGHCCSDSGGRYNPGVDRWRPISRIRAPSVRSGHSAVWTGTEMIIWGGEDGNLTSLNTGSRYDPETNRWTAIGMEDAPDPRQQHTAIWTGSEMVVWGGLSCYSGSCVATDSGGRYKPSLDDWRQTSLLNVPSWRYDHRAIWDGSRMMVWGPSSNGGLYCAGPLFGDDFEDGVLSDGWNYRKGLWTESNGQLIGVPINKKTVAIASPVFYGCTICEISTAIESEGGSLSIISLLGWYQNQSNYLELQVKPEADKWILKQRINGVVVAKKSKILQTDPDVSYDVRLAFDENYFKLFVNGSLVLSMIKSPGSAPFGTVGFQVKNTTGSFRYINVR